ncbi:hypothetical protein [Paludisphaera borealis]|uniref:Uncharacterized protein n=1 Tax=Paludisphaera borealis TaxID=1387353 RepID=A0A1U7CI94_9BACT|nr:hypothetical protein [Paludisphaera borealis]APW58627.1 hypothetical protein BSF38_00025 [Paludisphaera borealis]
MKKVRMTLEGLDGNAFALLGAFTENATRQGWRDEEIEVVRREAMAGDYRHLLQTLAAHTDDTEVEMRISWMSQTTMEPFTYPVPDMDTASLLLDALAQYDLFQFERKVKPDYANCGGAEWRHPILTGGEWVEFDPDDASDRMELAAMVAELAEWSRGDGQAN